MTTNFEPGKKSSAASDTARAMAEVAATSIVSTSLAEAGRGGLKGVVAASAGWIIEWVAGSSNVMPGLAPGDDRGQLVGALLFVVFSYAAVGAAYGMTAMAVIRGAFNGSLIVPRPGVPSRRTEPVWWARVIRDAVVVFIVVAAGAALWGLGQSFGNHVTVRSWQEALPYAAPIAGLAIAAAGLFRLFEMVERLFGWGKPLLLRSAPLWFLVCVFGTIAFTAITMAAALGLAWLGEPFLVAAGLGSPLRLATAIGLLPLALQAGYAMGRLIWEERDALRAPQLTEMWVPEAQDDFRNWDLEPETSFSGTALNGYPFYVWRESADNRIGLSRPRYCCITEADGDLQFTFFNPSEDVRDSGAVIAGTVVGAVVAITSLFGHWSAGRPYIPYAFDERLPWVLVVLGTAFSAVLLASLAGIVWHTLVTLFRWYRNRFGGDGRLTSKPLRSLMAFTELHAGEAGAKINGEEAKSGHGLVATFADGSMMILTGNAWNYASIVAKHRDLTNAFRLQRDDWVARWDEDRRRHSGQSGSTGASQSVPDTL